MNPVQPLNNNPSPVVNQTPIISTPTSPPTKSNSPIKILLLVIVVLVLGIMLGNYLNLNQMIASLISPQPKACTMEAKLCPDGTSVGRTGPNCEFSPCPITQATPDPTANWKMYNNPTYNFSFKYPSVYSEDIETQLSDNPDIQIALLKTTDGSIGMFLDQNKFDFNYLKQYAPTGSENFPPTSKVYGQNTFYYYGSGGGGVNYPDQFFYNLNEKILIIKFYGPYGDNEKSPSKATQQIEAQILSTFKFLDNQENQNSNTTNKLTKTYTGLGVSFDYPSYITLAKPINTEKVASGGFYQQSFTTNENVSVVLNIEPRKTNSDGSYESLDEKLKSISNKTDITLANQRAIKYENSADIPNAYNIFFTTLAKDSSSTITLNIFAQPADVASVNKGKELLNQIISTFKFLE